MPNFSQLVVFCQHRLVLCAQGIPAELPPVSKQALFGFLPYISAKDKHIYNSSFMWKLLWRPVFQLAKPNGSNQCVDNCLQKPGWSSSCTRKADVPLPGENMCAQHQMVNVDAACFCLCCFEE